jgi:endonuclease YncB( thermonuclease family)
MRQKNQAVILLIIVGLLTAIAQTKKPAATTAANTAANTAGNQQEIQQLERVTIDKVSDGDTVRLQDGRRIRFCGIDAPEKAQPLGPQATVRLAAIIQGEIRLQPIETDKYGRTVAELWVQKPGENIYTSVNAAMAQAGMAWHYAKYSQNCPSQAAIVAGETEAKGKRLGIWAGFNQPAWEWRQAQKAR